MRYLLYMKATEGELIKHECLRTSDFLNKTYHGQITAPPGSPGHLNILSICRFNQY